MSVPCGRRETSAQANDTDPLRTSETTPDHNVRRSSCAEIRAKDSRAGAWYGEVCGGCPFFACHDALMALRLTADRRLQFCLLREDITVPLDSALALDDDTGLAELVERAVQTYASATFHQPTAAQPLAVVSTR